MSFHDQKSCWPLAGLLPGFALALVLAASPARSAEPSVVATDTGTAEDEQALQRDLVSYPASFFERYQPVTALDMVNQVPGFRLATDTIDIRGFAEAPGNLLINDRRPSTKRDSLTDILSRIPASLVARIELIRGQVRNIDLRGEPEVINLVLQRDLPAAVQWRLAAKKTFGFGPVSPIASIALTNKWKDIALNVGLRGRRNSVGRTGTEDITDPQGLLLENRVDDRNNRNRFFTATLNASAWWGETFWQLNSNLNYTRRKVSTVSDRNDLVDGTTEKILFADEEEEPAFEIGIDFERELTSDLVAKAILIDIRTYKDILDIQNDFDGEGEQTLLREAKGSLDSAERIARLEFDLSIGSNHLVQANIERAYNELDSDLVQTDDTGSGPIFIEVPGANSRVAETRWDFLIQDIWARGRLEIDLGLGAEASTIRQTGDVELERDFFFLKPHLAFTFVSAKNNQTRLRIAREVAQLNLEDFVSATEFLDDDLALGNPNIKPDSTVKFELTRERRLGAEGVIKLTAFHDWISDVLDLLPLSPSFEAPGNIGDGRRWGVKLESTLPLDMLGLSSAKLDIKYRWQDSSVTDPVTGAERVLSVGKVSGGPIVFDIENRYAYEIEFRQDFREAQIAWGMSVRERAEQLQFKVNEFEVYDEGSDLRWFLETTRWANVKLRIDAENIRDFADTRDRRLFLGERDLSALESVQYRDRTRGRRLQFSVSGNF